MTVQEWAWDEALGPDTKRCVRRGNAVRCDLEGLPFPSHGSEAPPRRGPPIPEKLKSRCGGFLGTQGITVYVPWFQYESGHGATRTLYYCARGRRQTEVGPHPKLSKEPVSSQASALGRQGDGGAEISVMFLRIHAHKGALRARGGGGMRPGWAGPCRGHRAPSDTFPRPPH